MTPKFAAYEAIIGDLSDDYLKMRLGAEKRQELEENRIKNDKNTIIPEEIDKKDLLSQEINENNCESPKEDDKNNSTQQENAEIEQKKDETTLITKEKEKKFKTRVVHGDMCGILENFANRGICTGLLEFSQTELKKKGYEWWYQELTNHISLKWPKKNGWTVHKIIDYRNWKFITKGKKNKKNEDNVESRVTFPFAGIDPRDSLILMDTKL